MIYIRELYPALAVHAPNALNLPREMSFKSILLGDPNDPNGLNEKNCQNDPNELIDINEHNYPNCLPRKMQSLFN